MWARALLLMLGVVATAACGGTSPIAPSGASAAGSADLVVPPVLAASVALIDDEGTAVPLLGQPTGAWLRATVRGIVIDTSLPHEVRARCCGSDRLIHWSAGWLPDPTDPHDVRIAAGIIVHEARHAEGYAHTCPDGRRDRTFAEGGAWAVQALWLRHMGDKSTADSIATFEIGCE